MNRHHFSISVRQRWFFDVSFLSICLSFSDLFGEVCSVTMARMLLGWTGLGYLNRISCFILVWIVSFDSCIRGLVARPLSSPLLPLIFTEIPGSNENAFLLTSGKDNSENLASVMSLTCFYSLLLHFFLNRHYSDRSLLSAWLFDLLSKSETMEFYRSYTLLYGRETDCWLFASFITSLDDLNSLRFSDHPFM
jgi:hypothetical protein